VTVARWQPLPLRNPGSPWAPGVRSELRDGGGRWL